VRHRLLLAALVCLPVVITAFVIENFVRDVIAGPVLYAFWILRLFLASIPQTLIWVSLIVLGLVLAYRSLAHRPRLQTNISAEPPTSTRVEELARLIDQAEQSTFGRWRLSQRLGGLVVAMLADEQRVSQREIHRQIDRNELPLSPEMRAYLQARLSTVQGGGRLSRARTRPALDLDPNEIVQFLEDRLSSSPGGVS
jgi:hypothetical protein